MIKLMRNIKVEYIIIKETIKWVRECYQRHQSIKDTWNWTFGKYCRYKMDDNSPWIYNNSYKAMRKLYRG